MGKARELEVVQTGIRWGPEKGTTKMVSSAVAVESEVRRQSPANRSFLPCRRSSPQE